METDSQHRILQFRVEGPNLCKAIRKILTADLDCQLKRGAAPNSGLERAAQEILQKHTHK